MTIAQARMRIDEFTATVLALGEVRTEEERERVRSTGVNLFVSVEYFIQEVVAYNTWVLASDHFLMTRFMYDPKAAVANYQYWATGLQRLGEVITLPGQLTGAIRFGTLLAYMQKMLDWMNTRTIADRASVLRSKEDLPHYSDDPEQTFVFRHTRLMRPMRMPVSLTSTYRESQALSRRSTGLRSQQFVTVSITKGTSVRSRVQNRCWYAQPVSVKLLTCRCATFLQSSFWLWSNEADRFGRQKFAFQDYREKGVTLGDCPPVVSGLPKPRFREPMLIAAGNLLGEPNARNSLRDSRSK